MTDSTQRTHFRFWLWLIALIGVIVPRRLRADWRQEWEAELRYREAMLAEWDKLDWRHKLDLLWRSTSAFWDALLLQPQRLEDEMFQDLRYGMRMLVKHPGFTGVAVLTLALGIGANTAIFSLIDAVLLKRLPVKNPEQLVLVRHANSRRTVAPFAYRTYKQFRDQNQAFSGVLAYHPLRLSVSVDNRAEPAVAGQLVSGNYYSVLGVNAALGRTIAPEDDRAPGESPVCVISYNYWQRRFAGDPSLAQERLVATLSSGFGLLALLLSCLGLYGILSYTVARRTNEIGIRVALGAERRDVLWLVLRDALRLVWLGVAVGIPVALAAARLVASQLFGISAADPLTLGLATLVLLTVAAVAGYLPARRATRVDPLVALRYE